MVAEDEGIRLPEFLASVMDLKTYREWLNDKAAAVRKRDRNRGNASARGQDYRDAIHEAVLRCRGRDEYTGLPLDWRKILPSNRYDNEKSHEGGRAYKKEWFKDLPTVDHVGDGLGKPEFAICSGRVNDSKSDLELREFLELCRQILAHSGSREREP